MIVSAFITHKEAERFSDCQDRFSINPDTKSIALSDGMSQSIFQKYWAEILVDTFTSNPRWEPNQDSIKELSPIWRAKVDEYIELQKKEGKSTWRAEKSLIEGLSACATFVGVRFNGYDWKCNVLGDSCLIAVNDNQIQEIYSSQDNQSFDNFPDYFDSNSQKKGKGYVHSFEGTLKPGDALLLVSDPFSDFILRNRNTPAETILINRLLGVNSHKEFEEVVNDWRLQGMHNDDSTLIIIQPGNGDTFTLTEVDSICELIKTEKENLSINNFELSSPKIIDKFDSSQDGKSVGTPIIVDNYKTNSLKELSENVIREICIILRPKLKSKYKKRVEDICTEIINKIRNSNNEQCQ